MLLDLCAVIFEKAGYKVSSQCSPVACWDSVRFISCHCVLNPDKCRSLLRIHLICIYSAIWPHIPTAGATADITVYSSYIKCDCTCVLLSVTYSGEARSGEDFGTTSDRVLYGWKSWATSTRSSCSTQVSNLLQCRRRCRLPSCLCLYFVPILMGNNKTN